MNVLVTGASGFVGRYLGRVLALQGHRATGICRQPGAESAYSRVSAGDLTQLQAWSHELEGMDVVVHLAARAHVLTGSQDAGGELDLFRRINRDATLALASEAAQRGVRRFVFVSSIGVIGNSSGERPFDESSVPAPVASYAVSKLEAEEGLRALAERSGMDVVIIRPPLVYAADAPGNFARLLRLVARGYPLPFGLIRNRRSLISATSLAHFILLCAEHPAAANECFVIADDDVVSIGELVSELAAGMGRRVPLVPVPGWLLKSAAVLLKRERTWEQLGGNLEVNNAKARDLLGWRSAQSLREGLREVGRAFMKGERENDR